MRMLKMSGYPITNICDYRKNFNIYDILRQRREFLSFVLSNFAYLSKTFSYCYAMAHVALEGSIPIFMRQDSSAISEKIPLEHCVKVGFWNNPFGFIKDAAPDERLQKLSASVEEQFSDSLEDEELVRIMILFIAALSFCETETVNSKLDLEMARDYFLGNRKEQNRNPYEVDLADHKGENIQTVTLEPGEKPYTCFSYDNSDFQKIKTFRIEASKRIISLSNRSVKLNIEDRQISIPAGEHIYVNVIDGKVACILEKNRKKGNRSLKNIGDGKDVLSFGNAENETLSFLANEYISSFDFSDGNDSVVYIKNSKLCLDHCKSYMLYGELSQYLGLHFVDVRLRNHKYYLLKPDGELISNDPVYHGNKVSSIEICERGAGYESI